MGLRGFNSTCDNFSRENSPWMAMNALGCLPNIFRETQKEYRTKMGEKLHSQIQCPINFSSWGNVQLQTLVAKVTTFLQSPTNHYVSAIGGLPTYCARPGDWFRGRCCFVSRRDWFAGSCSWSGFRLVQGIWKDTFQVDRRCIMV